MKVILAYVMSLDGFLTDSGGRSPSTWASPEDQVHFKKLMLECGVVIFGSNTFEINKNFIEISKDILRVVLTRHPEKFAEYHVPGQLEFFSLSPQEILEHLKLEGREKVLIAAGPRLYVEFLREGLVDELHVTIEPLLFGSGLAAASGIPAHTQLETIDILALNQRSTLLVKYKVV